MRLVHLVRARAPVLPPGLLQPGGAVRVLRQVGTQIVTRRGSHNENYCSGPQLPVLDVDACQLGC